MSLFFVLPFRFFFKVIKNLVLKMYKDVQTSNCIPIPHLHLRAVKEYKTNVCKLSGK
jgi:hypothetical protein